MARQSRKKQPKVAQPPQPKKQPKAQEPTVHGAPLVWRFSSGDRGGDWAWTNLSDPALYKKVIEKLQEFEKMNWDEIIQSGSHPISVMDIVKLARDRLQTIHMDDIDELMSFRLTGRNRVWCIRQLNVMKILWWDPDHQICPAPKKHT